MVGRTDEDLRERFYRERDQRTLQYQGEPVRFNAPVAVVVGADAAATPAGQVAVLALVNMLARVHRRVRLDVPDVPPLAVPLVHQADLPSACLAVMKAIDPFCDVALGCGPGDAVVSIGIGSACPRDLTWYLGASGFCAALSREAVPMRADVVTRWGAALAACLGASAVFRSVHNLPARPCQVSLWDLTESANPGPSRDAPIAVGSVVVVGAGAVGSALCYWLREFGIDGHITVVDGDLAKLHNTNRTLGLVASDSGWPHPQHALRKADVAAGLVAGTAFPGWYDEWVKAEPNAAPDLIVPVANERGVRAGIQGRGQSLLVHASTSSAWTAELHRHIAERDDCMVCRMPSDDVPVFPCSTGSVEVPGTERTDAALPFLSGAAGLLLAGALAQLQEGRLLAGDRNHWRLHLDLGHKVMSSAQWQRRESCVHGLPSEVRARVAHGRWARVR